MTGSLLYHFKMYDKTIKNKVILLAKEQVEEYIYIYITYDKQIFNI